MTTHQRATLSSSIELEPEQYFLDLHRRHVLRIPPLSRPPRSVRVCLLGRSVSQGSGGTCLLPVMISPTRSLKFPQGTMKTVSGSFVVPQVSALDNWVAGYEYRASTWVGIDGFRLTPNGPSCPNMLQSGIDTLLTLDVNGIPTYSCCRKDIVPLLSWRLFSVMSFLQPGTNGCLRAWSHSIRHASGARPAIPSMSRSSRPRQSQAARRSSITPPERPTQRLSARRTRHCALSSRTG
jgi:hypothetical protein